MATRKAITLVSGLFQEVNTPTDKLDFAGNTTADLAENTNLYFTNARARSAISASGDISYNSSTGVISFTASAAPVTSVNSATGAVVLDTGDIAESGKNSVIVNPRIDRPYLTAGGWHKHPVDITETKEIAPKNQLSDPEIQRLIANITNLLELNYQNRKSVK